MVRLSEPRSKLRVLNPKPMFLSFPETKCTGRRGWGWPSPEPRDSQSCAELLTGLRGRDGNMSLDEKKPHLFGKVPGIRGEVGGQHQLPFNDLIHSFLPVFCGEGRLEKAEGKGSLGVLPPSPAPTWKGSPQHPPCSQGSWTCRSSEHVVHQGSQAPPVHCPVVTNTH